MRYAIIILLALVVGCGDDDDDTFEEVDCEEVEGDCAETTDECLDECPTSAQSSQHERWACLCLCFYSEYYQCAEDFECESSLMGGYSIDCINGESAFCPTIEENCTDDNPYDAGV